jgi:undecaprenyl-diphosphatase
MYEIDAALTHAINAMAGQSVIGDFVMLSLTKFGVPVMVIAVALQWWRRRDRQHMRYVIVVSGCAFLLGLGFNQLILLFIQRARPYEAGITRLLIEPTIDFSFPSDHSTAAFAIAAAFLAYGSKRVGAAFLIASVLVCVSRVYVGTHYVSDIIGGAFVGTVAALAVGAVYREGSRADRLITDIL